MFNWITIELTNRCNKSCWFCGRAKIRDKMELGDMDYMLFLNILKQYNGEILQFSRDGEPLLYDRIGDIGMITRNYFTNIVTNGILLWDKKMEIHDRFDTVTVSVIEDDKEQFEAIRRFVEWNGTSKPSVFVKFLGDYYNPEFEKMVLKVMRRTLHNPQGDWDYQNHTELIPEIGICQDFMNKPSINWKGEMFICNRFDPEKKGLIGDLNKTSMTDIWDGTIRYKWLQYHRNQERDRVPLCNGCQFWGVPRYV